MSEVLITLGIIGIVAAMTIPTLISDYKAKVLQTQLKKTYNMLNKVLDMYELDHAGVRITSDNTNTNELKELILPYFKVAQDCGYGFNDDNACIKNYSDPTKGSNSTDYTTLTGDTLFPGYFNDGQFILADGSFVLIENALLVDGHNAKYRLFISVDINGLNQGPNQAGRDLFMFQINDEGELLAMGGPGTVYNMEDGRYCTLKPKFTPEYNGFGCTYKALYDPNYFKNLFRNKL